MNEFSFQKLLVCCAGDGDGLFVHGFVRCDGL